MARSNQDPLEMMIAGGRVNPQPTVHYGLLTIIEVDLEQLRDNVLRWLVNTLVFYEPLRLQYRDDDTIARDLEVMLDFAIANCYNRLRNVLERYNPGALSERMNSEAPVSSSIEMPTYLASVLGSIGPFRLQDAATDKLIVYATATSRMNFFGRSNLLDLKYGPCATITSALRKAGIGLATIDCVNVTPGFCFPTILNSVTGYVWTVSGTIHTSHYENEDIARAILVSDPRDGSMPFENVSFTVGLCKDEAVLNAVAAAAAPEGVTTAATAAGHPVGTHYRVNRHGIQPDAGHIPRGIYIIGRGNTPAFSTVLACQLNSSELWEMLQYRLTSP